MKLIKKIGLASIAFLLGASLASCKPKKPEAKTIAEVLQQDNATETVTKGVVFAKTSDGIYINDGTASIFVLGGLDAKVKDEVTVEGNFTLVNKMPEIKTPTVTVNESNKEELKPTVKTVAEIASLDEAVRTNYGLYYTVSATVTKNSFGQYALEDNGATVYINDKSNTAALADWELKDVNIDVVTTNKSGEGWNVSYCKTSSDITEIPVALDEVKEEIFTYVQGKMPANVYGSLNLVKTYENIPNVSLTWSVKEAGTIAITNNVATVSMPETDTQVTLVLTLGNGSQTVSREYVVTNKAIRHIEIADLPTTSYSDKENIIVEGKVVLTTRSNGTIYSNIIVDSTGQYFARIDSDETECQKYHVGDEIRVLGRFKVSNGIQCIDAATIERIKEGTSQEIDWESFASIPLVTEADYITLADGMDSEEGIPLMLFKIENPYITTSAASGYNYLRFGTTPSSAKSGVTAADKNKNTASLALSAMNFTMGNNEYTELFDIGGYDEGAIKNVGLTMYAFCGFNLENRNTAQFVFAKSAIKNDLAAGVEAEVLGCATTINASTEGTHLLPKEIGGVTINWAAECPIYNLETGAYTVAEETKTYTFTATYTIGGVSYSKDINITFEAAPATYISVSAFNALPSTTVANVEGSIIAFATANPDVNNKKVIYGLYVSDGTEIAYISEAGLTYDSTIQNGYEALYTYGAEKTPYAIGDLIRIQKATRSSTGIEITSDSKISVIPENQVEGPFVFEPTAYETVSSQEDFKNVLAEGTNILVKVVATDENPLCLGCSTCSTSDTASREINVVNKIRIYFLEGATSHTTTTIKPDGTHTVATKCIASELNLGVKWWTQLGNENFKLEKANTQVDVQFTGSFYMSLTIISGSFYMVTILPYAFNLRVKA